jgi:cyclomaltodextrinase / maltogenic alpha-amylase / neopullulanase
MHWSTNTIFYHIYPLGFTGAPHQNDFSSNAVPRLEKIYSWLDHIQYLGANALYLGPLFESTAHGYDTADYFHVDRRLGTRGTLAQLSDELHRRGMRLILDGVFNHVGRDFWAFRDVLQQGRSSAYVDWFYLDFSQPGPKGDPFTYQTWAGHYSLVKLNLHNPDVRRHLFEAVEMWVHEFDIDGLRLDAADAVDLDFLKALSAFGRSLRPDFWLVGEIIHGDYRQWANPDTLDSVTNYEVYKSLYSSHVDRNYFELAYALNRQFGAGGIYRGLPLYTFADNHDVDRVASSLRDARHLYPLHILLFTMPGVPSIYYGSEWGISGARTPFNDRMLRPALGLSEMNAANPHPDLPGVIHHLAQIHKSSQALSFGDYEQLQVNSEQFAFMRQAGRERILVAVNASNEPAAFHLPLPGASRLVDHLNSGEEFEVQGGQASFLVAAGWGRVLRILA